MYKILLNLYLIPICIYLSVLLHMYILGIKEISDDDTCERRIAPS